MFNIDLLIFGAGSHARRLARAFQSRSHQVHAFITSRPNAHEQIDGIPVYCLDSLPAEMLKIDTVAIGVFNRSDSYKNIAESLTSHGHTTICWPWDYFPYLHDSLGWCYWLDPEPKSLSDWQQKPSYQQLASLLADQKSRDVVDRILSFRSGSDLPFSVFRLDEPQYFNQLTLAALPNVRPVRYLDVGAFNGDTLHQLCQCAEVGTAVLLEPDQNNYKSLVTNVVALIAEFPCLRPLALPLGAGSEYGTFSLSGEGEAVTLKNFSENHGAEHHSITVARVDDLLPAEAIDFVKIDVEGYDRQAIQGMEKLLLRCAPVIAVSLYHRPRDIIDIPLYLNQILSSLEYQYFIRQHMSNSFDTVLYAVPPSS